MQTHLLVQKIGRRLGLFGVASMLGLLVFCAAFSGGAAHAAPAATKCARTDTKCVIGAGNQDITTRLTALNTLNNQIATELGANHITSDQANALKADVATNESGLNTLKGKLDAETGAPAARQDVKNIFVVFRIFAVVLPRDYQQLHFNIETKLDGKMQSVKAQIQQAIAKAPASKQAKLNALFNDYKSQLATAENQFDTVQAKLPTLTPESFNTNHATYESNLSAIRKAERTAHTALHQAAKDLHQIAQLLK